MEYKNILQSIKPSSECYKTIPLSGQNFGAAGITILFTKTIQAHVEPDCPGLIIDNVYIKQYNSRNYLTAIPLNQAF
jgi:hypothetical protein